jgi:type 1 glutamine amidotransferase
MVEIADKDHPITKGLEPFETLDELYTCLMGEAPIHVVAQARSKVDQKYYPMAFVLDYGKGRVYQTVLGHDARAYTNSPGVGELMRRGCAWAAGLPPTPDGKPPQAK